MAEASANIGSNFFLTNRYLSADYKKGFNTLFLELSRSTGNRARLADSLSERVSGVEPPFLPWEGSVEPINYTRNGQLLNSNFSTQL